MESAMLPPVRRCGNFSHFFNTDLLAILFHPQSSADFRKIISGGIIECCLMAPWFGIPFVWRVSEGRNIDELTSIEVDYSFAEEDDHTTFYDSSRY
jgi:hypothetical protein